MAETGGQSKPLWGELDFVETLRRSGTEGRNLHVVTDTSFPDWQGLCLREQACAGLGLLFTGCRAQKRLRLTGGSGPGCPLLHPWEAHTRAGVLGACGLVSSELTPKVF